MSVYSKLLDCNASWQCKLLDCNVSCQWKLLDCNVSCQCKLLDCNVSCQCKLLDCNVSNNSVSFSTTVSNAISSAKNCLWIQFQKFYMILTSICVINMEIFAFENIFKYQQSYFLWNVVWLSFCIYFQWFTT